MHSPRVTLRNLFILFNIILLSSQKVYAPESDPSGDISLQKVADLGKPFDEEGNLERKTMFAVNIQAAHAIKRIDLVLPESKAQRSHVQNLKGLVKSFLTTQDYLYFAEGIHDCRKPLLIPKNTNKILGLTPFSMTSGHTLDELEFSGYRIRFSQNNIANSPLLQGLQREKVLIEDVNDLLITLTFLASETSDKFWHNLNQNILDDKKTAEILRSKLGILTFKLAASKNNAINTNTFMVQHMLYNRILLDDVFVFVEVLKYLRERGLDTSIIFGSNAMLHEYFVKEDLAETEKLHGRRVAMDKLLAKYRFSYPNLVQALANISIFHQGVRSPRKSRSDWGDVQHVDAAASKVNAVAPKVNEVAPKVPEQLLSDTCENCNKVAVKNHGASNSILRTRKKKWDIPLVATLIIINWNVFMPAH